MELQQMYKNTSVSNFINQYISVTAVHRAIQRKSVWSKNDMLDYKVSLENNWAVNQVTIADLESSLNVSKMNNNQTDIDFFTELLNQKYIYISIDGNNRTQYLKSEFDKFNQDFRNSPNDVRKILNNNVNICVVYNATKNDLHQMVLKINSGKGFNDAEKRNTIDGVISNYIRKVSDKFQLISTKIKGVKSKITRMLDDEMYANFLYFNKTSVSTIDKHNLEYMYRTETKVDDSNVFEKTLKLWENIIENVINLDSVDYSNSKGKKKKSKDVVDKSFAYNLFFFLCEVQRKYNYKLNDKKIVEFSKRYLELENNRIIKHTNLETKVCYWSELNRSTTKKIDTKLKMILDDFGDEVHNFFFTISEKRTFPKDYRIVKCVETNGVIKRNDGSEIVVRPTQVLNGGFVDSGHIEHYSEGGTDDYDNLQLEVDSDNREKGNRF